MEKIAIHEIPGFSMGQVEDLEAGTGCTVILCPEGAVTGVDVRGGSPGTRDTDALDPTCNREHVHSVVLTGGSAFGLDAAGGVAKKLEEMGIGRDVMVTVVPNVCAAVLFDLKFGRMDIRPDQTMGYTACEKALEGGPFQEGNHGAGTG
ncbi:MAG: P1 family peptidase, partial [Ruminiclostridium sp.]|nr:P1 family peptidase [Ruminiclostridium sp.]